MLGAAKPMFPRLNTRLLYLVPCGGHSSGSTTADGGFGGGQSLQFWQRDRLVFGLEADIQGAGVDGSVTVGGPASGSTSLDWFGTVRGRLGLTVMGGTSLVYVTGGLAYGGVDDKLTVPGASKSDSQVAAGYAAGRPASILDTAHHGL